MRRHWIMIALAGAMAVGAYAQQAQEITFYSNEGYSGARFTVTGPRTILDLPFTPRSAMLQGGGSWELCPQRSYDGGCWTITQSERSFRYPQVRSIRPASTGGTYDNWREIARLDVRDRADRDTAYVRTNDLFREVKVCAERNTVRIRRAEVQLGNGYWQRMFVPLALTPGNCSDAIDLMGNARRIRAVRFEYESWTAGIARGTVTVKALPYVERQPR
ncbi:MAG: hypothetical protein IBJ12_10735 [Sphingomonadaceae bacterium]|nr:hypothetical protein [Sphingomonadaceae bacterium]